MARGRRAGMPRFSVVLCDLFDTVCRIDETLYLAGKRAEADILGLPHEAFAEAWVAAGDAAQTGRLADLPARIRHVAAVLGVAEPASEVVGRVAAIEVDTLRRATTLHPDTRPVLEDLRARPGLRTGLVSNASSPTEGLFDHLGLRRYFDAVTWSFRVGATKPEPAIYLDACRALAVAPSECLFVGDGNARELDGARALGMTAVRIERDFSLGPY